MVTLNLLGCCIIRDTFRICDAEQRYKILKFFQFTSPVSFCEEPQNVPRLAVEDLDAFPNWSNFVKRNICADACKTVLSDVSETPSDYIALDLCELRFHHCLVTLENGESFCMTKNKYLTQILNAPKSVKNFKVRSAEIYDTLPESKVYSALDKFISFLKAHYSPDRVILVKNLPAQNHLDDEQAAFYEYSAADTEALRNRLSGYYRYFEEHFPGIHSVDVPKNALGNVHHTWGRDPLHFIDEYYRYLYRAINIAVAGGAGEKEALRSLKETYESYFALLERSKRTEYSIFAQGFALAESGSMIDPSEEGGTLIAQTKRASPKRGVKPSTAAGNALWNLPPVLRQKRNSAARYFICSSTEKHSLQR